MMNNRIKGLAAAVAAVAALGVGGAAIASATGNGPLGDNPEDAAEGPDRAIGGSALDKASAAALEFTGGGQVSDTEVGDEESYYEVEVTRDDGSQVDVQLDRDFDVFGDSADEESR